MGGALRREDRAAIGYYGVEKFPVVITALDLNRPIYDQSNLYVDAVVSYLTRIFGNKIAATLQLNVCNLTEDGRIQNINAYADGSASAFIKSPGWRLRRS